MILFYVCVCSCVCVCLCMCVCVCVCVCVGVDVGVDVGEKQCTGLYRCVWGNKVHMYFSSIAIALQKYWMAILGNTFGLSNLLRKPYYMVSQHSGSQGHLYLVDWTRDWTVGLDYGTGLTESCAHHTFRWLKRHGRFTASTYQICMRIFSCNTDVISV